MLRPLLATTYHIFVSEYDETDPWICVYHIYLMSTNRREKLLQFVLIIIAHLGVFAFLFQVFQDEGPIMKACCYFQLGSLLMCFLLYVMSYLLDMIALH
jgi:uncharacterized membrane protein